jgi:hypothetical protein
MRDVMAPQPGGLFAVLDAAPDADVVFVGHTGLDRMVTVADLWRELPMGKEIVMQGWHVPAERVPRGARSASGDSTTGSRPLTRGSTRTARSESAGLSRTAPLDLNQR